jgi:hypothetical protein
MQGRTNPVQLVVRKGRTERCGLEVEANRRAADEQTRINPAKADKRLGHLTGSSRSMDVQV